MASGVQGGLLSRSVRSTLETWTTEGCTFLFALKTPDHPAPSDEPCEVAPGGGKESHIAQDLPTLDVGFSLMDHHSEVMAASMFPCQTDACVLPSAG